MGRPLPRIAVTMGDPAGVGPEICLRILHDSPHAIPCVFGDATLLRRVAHQLGMPFTVPILSHTDWQQRYHEVAEPCVIDHPVLDARQVLPGVLRAENGRAAYHYIQSAMDAAMSHQVAAVTTGPINKEALALADIHYPGHTEMFAERCAVNRWCMMQYSEQITCTFVTVHVGYADVPRLLTIPRILEVIELTAEGLQKIRGSKPKIVVCGLNPHAGEHGLFGHREEEIAIIPAIEQARQRGINVEGPLPPDTAFLPAKRAVTDAFVCMYHDQGHIPLKALAFDSAVNTTLGLPMIRTSVDHGTAFDIAWQGIADASSMKHALLLATKLSQAT